MGIASRPAAFTRSRIVSLLFGLGLLFTTPQCLFTGLDDYSSAYGKPDDAGAPPDSEPPPDGGCMCGPGEACVLGVCEACTPTWVYDHKALRQGDVIILDHHVDPATRTLYVTSSRQDGQGPRRGYLAEVHTCRGTLLSASDGATVNGKLVPGLLRMARHGDSIFAKLQLTDPAVVMAGYARYDTKNHTFTEIFEIPPFAPGEPQGAWMLDVAPSGKVHWWGEWYSSAQGIPTPLGMHADGSGKVCVKDMPSLAGGSGRAMTTNGNDVYASVVMSAAKEVRVVRFDDAACDVASCNCPVAEELPPLVLSGPPNVMGMKVVGSTLIVAGFTMKTDTDWVGFVAQYNFATKTWSSVYTYDEGPLLEGFLGFDSDGSFLYVNGFRNYVFGDSTTASSDIFKFPLPISAASSPTRIPVPSIRAAFGLDLDGDGILLSGYSAANGVDGRSARCTLEACP